MARFSSIHEFLFHWDLLQSIIQIVLGTSSRPSSHFSPTIQLLIRSPTPFHPASKQNITLLQTLSQQLEFIKQQLIPQILFVDSGTLLQLEEILSSFEYDLIHRYHAWNVFKELYLDMHQYNLTCIHKLENDNKDILHYQSQLKKPFITVLSSGYEKEIQRKQMLELFRDCDSLSSFRLCLKQKSSLFETMIACRKSYHHLLQNSTMVISQADYLYHLKQYVSK